MILVHKVLHIFGNSVKVGKLTFSIKTKQPFLAAKDASSVEFSIMIGSNTKCTKSLFFLINDCNEWIKKTEHSNLCHHLSRDSGARQMMFKNLI